MRDEPEMIERVARALVRKRVELEIDADGFAVPTNPDFYADIAVDGADRAEARAAIAAMRTPDDSMIRAGNLHREVLGNTGISIADTWSTYEAMIDAALAGSRTPPDR